MASATSLERLGTRRCSSSLPGAYATISATDHQRGHSQYSNAVGAPNSTTCATRSEPEKSDGGIGGVGE